MFWSKNTSLIHSVGGWECVEQTRSGRGGDEKGEEEERRIITREEEERRMMTREK